MCPVDGSDVVFFLVALCTPFADALPEARAWRPRDSALRWEYTVDKGLSVRAFGDTPLTCCAYNNGGTSAPTGLALPIWQWWGKSDRPRAPPSAAEPTALLRTTAADELKETGAVTTEFDVLHVRKLPDFGCALRIEWFTWAGSR